MFAKRVKILIKTKTGVGAQCAETEKHVSAHPSAVGGP